MNLLNINISFSYWKLIILGCIAIFFLGLIISYMANILRMAMIILAGHYWGMDALEFVHSYLGWLLFTGWMLLFWLVFESLFMFVFGGSPNSFLLFASPINFCKIIFYIN